MLGHPPLPNAVRLYHVLVAARGCPSTRERREDWSLIFRRRRVTGTDSLSLRLTIHCRKGRSASSCARRVAARAPEREPSPQKSKGKRKSHLRETERSNYFASSCARRVTTRAPECERRERGCSKLLIPDTTFCDRSTNCMEHHLLPPLLHRPTPPSQQSNHEDPQLQVRHVL